MAGAHGPSPFLRQEIASLSALDSPRGSCLVGGRSHAEVGPQGSPRRKDGEEGRSDVGRRRDAKRYRAGETLLPRAGGRSADRSTTTRPGASPSRASTSGGDARAAAPKIFGAASERLPVHGILRHVSTMARQARRQDAPSAQGRREVFVDYWGRRPSYIDPQTGEQVEVELFVAVLGASNYTYAEAMPRNILRKKIIRPFRITSRP